MNALRLCVVLCSLSCLVLADTCDDQLKPEPNPPAMPRVFKENKSYQAHVEVNILDQNRSLEMDEYLDFMGNRGVMIRHENGETVKRIFLFETDEVFEIKDDSCTVSNVSGVNDYATFGYTMVDQKKHVVDSAASFFFGANATDIYQGSTQVRGVPAYKWSTCMQWPGGQGKMKVSFYFSMEGWQTGVPSEVGPIPLRVEIEGKSSSQDPHNPLGPQLPSGQGRSFHHVYDIVNFHPIVLDYSVFQFPEGVVCKNRTNTKPLPTFKKFFNYQTEYIDNTNKVTHYRVWYDELYKLYRIDTRREAAPPVYSTNSLTEVHDYNVGVRYIRDHFWGNCSVWPLNEGASDAHFNIKVFEANGSMAVDMRDPNSFFHFNDNYVYVGQRIIREVPCDVYSAVIPNYQLDYTTVSVDAVFEYAFMSEGYVDVPLSGQNPGEITYPMQLHISVKDKGYSVTFNFYGFDEEHSPLSVFDVSDCFDNQHRVDFKMIFPGQFKTNTRNDWETKVPIAIATAALVSPLRVGKVRLSSDANTVAVWGSLFSSSNAQQFELQRLSIREQKGDAMFTDIHTPDDCATQCIRHDYNNQGFRCKSFDFCFGDGTCRISKTGEPSGPIVNETVFCDHFSRTIANVDVTEPPLQDAYDRLDASVDSRRVQVTIADPLGYEQLFQAIAIEPVSGATVGSKPMPSLPGQMSYRIEVVIPSQGRTVETYVWYDQALKLVRFDQRDPVNGIPYQLTHIHDFNKGVAYLINQVTEICTVSPIPTDKGLFDLNATMTSDGKETLMMKDPLSLLYIDNTYRYVGQRSARGILCDVFESQRSDYNIKAFNVSGQTSLFRYYFQADFYDYTTVESNDITRTQPVMLEIFDGSVGVSTVVNFFDFDDEHHAMKYYDISKCFGDEERKDLILEFEGQRFHPFLDEISNSFINNVILKLSQVCAVSPTHIQNVELSYDDISIYIFFTLLGKEDPVVFFTRTVKINLLNGQSKAMPYHTLSDCAADCMKLSQTYCDSFDYCPNDKSCLTSNSYSVGSTVVKDPNGNCTHYSRSEKWSFPQRDIQSVYDILIDTVFRNFFQIEMDLPESSKTFFATDVRETTIRPSSPDSDRGALLQKFQVKHSYTISNNYTATTHSQVTVTDCAALCLQENTFECQAFSYQFSIGQCKLSDTHPYDVTGAAVSDVFSDVYQRFYTAEYTKFQSEVLKGAADKVGPNVQSDDMCARACNNETSFRCESFETCPNDDGTLSCLLKKGHGLVPNSKQTAASSLCSLYSRNHLYDYILREKQQIVGHDALKLYLPDPESCAQACAKSDLLPGCSSFEMCQEAMGKLGCVLSTADPTQDKSLTISTTRMCSLFTVANPLPIVNPTPHQASSTANHDTQKASVVTFQPNSPTRQPTVTPKSPTNNQTPCTQQQSGQGTSDTGARVGIAFGTLALGLVVGFLISFMVLKYKYNLGRSAEDATMLKTWDTK